jgi:hypothetical protein
VAGGILHRRAEICRVLRESNFSGFLDYIGLPTTSFNVANLASVIKSSYGRIGGVLQGKEPDNFIYALFVRIHVAHATRLKV